MASKEQVEQAIGCLSVAFPQYIAKELAVLTDQIVASVQGFTDPLKSAADLNIQQLLSDVTELSDGDIWESAENAGIGLGAYLAQREIEIHMDSGSEPDTSTTSRMTSFRKGIETGREALMLAMNVYNDFPYAAAQKMCETLIDLTELKIKNLTCLKQHITQLVNLVLAVVESASTYKDETLADLDSLAVELAEVRTELGRSRVLSAGSVSFDSDAFTRARLALADAIRILSPIPEEGTTILDVTEVLLSGSSTTNEVRRANVVAANMTIPALQHVVSLEASAVVAQIDVINHYVNAILGVVDAYTRSGASSQAAVIRSQLISDMTTRIDDVYARVNAARSRGSTRLASLEMMLWTAKLKTVQAMAEKVKSLSYQVGSFEGPDRALALSNAFEALRSDLMALTNSTTTDGIEGYTDFRSQVNGLVSGSQRIMEDLSKSEVNEPALTNFHVQAAVIAERQRSFIEESILLAQEQRAIAESYIANAGSLVTRERYNDFVDIFRQMGQDRAVDFMNEGKFDELLGASVDELSYLGLAAQCLLNAALATDDVQTRRNLLSIRDEITAKLDNKALAAADSSDTGVARVINNTVDQIAEIQAHAATVENILEDLKALGERLEINVEQASQGWSQLTQNLEKLDVGAGGRLAGDLEEYSPIPKRGVPLCFPV